MNKLTLQNLLAKTCLPNSACCSESAMIKIRPKNSTKIKQRILITPTLVAMTLIALFMSSAAWADPELIRRAQQLLASGNAKQAYMNLIAAQDRLAENVEFNYLLGVAALDSGKVDEAIISFERVLAANPKNAGAKLDLARAYFAVGSFDLAESSFRELAASNPPAETRAAIDRYLDAIAAKRNQGKQKLFAWGETSLGYDTNITGVPADFTSAVQSAFNLVGVNPTGNSIKRKAPYLAVAAGADYVLPLNAEWSALLGGELRGRAYRREGDFNSGFGEIRVGGAWVSGQQNWRVMANANLFDQDGAAPGDPKPTNARTAATVSAEYRYAFSSAKQLSISISGGQTRFPKNKVEDFNSSTAILGWSQVFEGNSSPLWILNGFYSDDKAVRTLADGVTDKSKNVSGIRHTLQYSLTENLSIFNTLGATLRKDKSAFARANTVEFGRDTLADAGLGVNWRFQSKCSLRVQWLGSRNHSNIAIYDYTRHEVSSNIRCDVE